MVRHAYEVMDLKALRCFHMMARCGSITQASIELGISGAAVSQRLKALEGYLEVKLYESRGGRVRLTMEGDKLLSFANSLFDQIEGIESEIDGGQEEGRISLASDDAIIRYLLTERIEAFQQKYPTVKLRLVTRPVEETIQLVRANECDLGVVAKRNFEKALRFDPIATYPACLILSKEHPLAARARSDFQCVLDKEIITRYPIIVLDPNQEGQRAFEVLTQLDLALKIGMEVSTVATLKHYVARGLGIAVISQLSITPDDESRLEIVELPKELKGKSTYGVITRQDKHRSPLLGRFVEILLGGSPDSPHL